MVSGKLQHTFVAAEREILFTSPGVISDSWIITGIWRCLAARTTGTATKPPLEKTTSGFQLFQDFYSTSHHSLLIHGTDQRSFGSK